MKYKVTTNNSGTTISELNITSISNLSGVTHHYDASGLVLNASNIYGNVDSNGNVSQWNNLVGANNLTQVLTAKQPMLDETNGIKSVNFSSYYLEFQTLFDLINCTIIFIYKPNITITPSTPFQSILGCKNQGTPDVCYFGFGSISGKLSNETLSFLDARPSNGNFWLGTYLVSNIQNIISNISVFCKNYIIFNINNSVYYPTERLYYRINPTVITLKDVKYLSAIEGGSSNLNGNVYEVIIVNRQINDDEKLFLDTYLNNKYGI